MDITNFTSQVDECTISQLVNVASYENAETVHDFENRIAWAYQNPQDRFCFTPELMRDMSAAYDGIRRLCSGSRNVVDLPFRYIVTASRTPSIYNLGSDLLMVADLIRSRNKEKLHEYGHRCIDMQYNRYLNFQLPVVTVSLVQGDALGGGFESALADDIIIAERSSKFGLPEILFNLYPGMGAYSFLSRRIGVAQTEKMILSGKIYTAEELYELGLIEVLAEDGEGEEAVQTFVQDHHQSFDSLVSTYKMRRLVNPLTKQELNDTVDLWVESAFRMDDLSLRKMKQLAITQEPQRAIEIEIMKPVTIAG